MYYPISMVIALLFSTLPQAHNLSESPTFCRVKIVNSTDSILIVRANCEMLPGVVLTFDSSYFLIFQRLDDSIYTAKYYTLVRSGMHKRPPRIGTEIHVRVSNYPSQKGNTYWLDIQNNYLSSKYRADAQWLHLANSSSKGTNTLQVGDPIMLAIKNPPLEGYLCLFAIDSSQSTIIFPNSREGTQNQSKITYRGMINLTYHRENGLDPAFLNVFFKAKEPGNLCFVAIICTTPKALIDFLPKEYSSIYQGLDGKEINPWTIGPGFYDPKVLFKLARGIEYMEGDVWATSTLRIKVL